MDQEGPHPFFTPLSGASVEGGRRFHRGGHDRSAGNRGARRFAAALGYAGESGAHQRDVVDELPQSGLRRGCQPDRRRAGHGGHCRERESRPIGA